MDRVGPIVMHASRFGGQSTKHRLAIAAGRCSPRVGRTTIAAGGAMLAAPAQAQTARLQSKKLYRNNKAINKMLPDGAEEAL